MRSIRSYLLIRLLGGTAAVLAVAGAVIYVVLTRSLADQFDRNLADRVQGFASILFQVADQVEFQFSGQLMPEYERADAPDYFELRYDDGELLERSESLAGGVLQPPRPVDEAPSFWTAPLPDGRSGRFVARRIEIHHVFPEEGPDRPQARRVDVVVARGREPLVAAERAALLACAAGALLLMALTGAVSWTAVQRGLGPARRLAAALDAIEVEHLPERLELGELPSELAAVAEKTDALIRRVQQALERERRTAADIAHELRTPISELLTVAEVALRNGREPGGERRALGTVRDVAWRMASSISTLLKLARLEMGEEGFAHEPVDLSASVRESLPALAAQGRERQVAIDVRVPPGQQVLGDGGTLSIIVANLLGNALYYAPRGSRVDCVFETSGPRWRLVVANPAPELGQEDLAALSRPFWRKDRARADRSRSGLGLALSRALAEATGLQLAFELEHGTFRAVLSGPGPVSLAAPSVRAS